MALFGNDLCMSACGLMNRAPKVRYGNSVVKFCPEIRHIADGFEVHANLYGLGSRADRQIARRETENNRKIEKMTELGTSTQACKENYSLTSTFSLTYPRIT